MIDGLKIKVSSTELMIHLAGRAEYHRKRAAQKESELPGLREAMERIKSHQAPATVAHMNKSNYRLDTEDPIRDLETDIRNHQNKALAYDFFAAHLFDEDYVLADSDLVRLEILRPY